jgi:ATP-dependent RNA circularization protein (DNA/RNA ligase family)
MDELFILHEREMQELMLRYITPAQDSSDIKWYTPVILLLPDNE